MVVMKRGNTMELTLKTININKRMSEETVCFDAAVYADGKRAGTVCNRGCGGSNEYHWADSVLGAEIEVWAEKEVIVTEDPIDPEKVMLVSTEKLDWKIGEIIEVHESKMWFRAKCRGKVLFRLKGDDDESWRTLKLRDGGKYTDETKAWMVKRYGDELAEIANETRV
jgi:hypothetical protein